MRYRFCGLLLVFVLLVLPAATRKVKPPPRLSWGTNFKVALQHARQQQVPMLMLFRDSFGHDYAHTLRTKGALILKNLPGRDEKKEKERLERSHILSRETYRQRVYEKREQTTLRQLDRLWRWRRLEEELFRDPEVVRACQTFERLTIDLGTSANERTVALAVELKVLSQKDLDERVKALVYPPRVKKVKIKQSMWVVESEDGIRRYIDRPPKLVEGEVRPRRMGYTMKEVELDATKLLTQERTAIVITSTQGEVLFRVAGLPNKARFLEAVEFALGPYKHWHQAQRLLARKDEPGALLHLAAIVEQKPTVKRLVEQAGLKLAPIEKQARQKLRWANEALKAGRKPEALKLLQEMKLLNYDKISAEIASQIEAGLKQAQN